MEVLLSGDAARPLNNIFPVLHKPNTTNRQLSHEVRWSPAGEHFSPDAGRTAEVLQQEVKLLTSCRWTTSSLDQVWSEQGS